MAFGFRLLVAFGIVRLSIGLASASAAAVRGIYREPAVSRTHIAFVCANRLFVMSRARGMAVQLVEGVGLGAPRFSPDGARIAFGGSVGGAYDLHTIPITGGATERMTHFPAFKGLCQWTAGRGLLFYTSAFSHNQLVNQLYTLAEPGGLPQRLPVRYGAEASLSADGTWLAYVTVWPNNLNRTRKRYVGGMANDIWLLNLRTRKSRRITTWEGTDNIPMWHGGSLYYVSDAGPGHRLNIWRYSPSTGRREQVTRLTEFDVLSPSIGPGTDGKGEIIFQYGADLQVVDLGTGRVSPIEVSLPAGAEPENLCKVDAGRFITSGALSPAGDAAAVEARGDLWTLTLGGSPKNLTATSGVFERDPAWSPDGRWIAFFSDSTDDYELTLLPADGAGPARTVTKLGPGFRYGPTWSPDSRAVAFVDQSNTLFVCEIETGALRRVARDGWRTRVQYAWSHDSGRLAYTHSEPNRLRALWTWDRQTFARRRMTSGMTDDFAPVLSRDGKTLTYVSRRNFSATVFDSISSLFVMPTVDALVSIPLDGVSSLGLPESASVVLPTASGNLNDPAVTDDDLLVYGHTTLEGRRSIRIRKPGESSDSVVVEGTGTFQLSTDGRRLLVFRGGAWLLMDAAASQQGTPVPTTGMEATIDLRAERRQIFRDVWRLYRDFHYDPGMHGLNWRTLGHKYGRLMDRCLIREDLNFVLEEMVAELNSGHAYLSSPGDVARPPSTNFGLLGADYALDRGAYRMTRIYRGSPQGMVRGPLGQPKLAVRVGDYLLAVADVLLDARRNPWAALQGKAGMPVTITVSAKPVLDASARKLQVTPVGNENSIRYAEWLDETRQYVDKRTGGRVGFLHIPDYNGSGAAALMRQLYAQVDKQALIVDTRWSPGGFLGAVFAMLLGRPRLNVLGDRYIKSTPIPERALLGPKCLLINGVTVSAGENFASYFRQARIGKLVGTRTWGGFVGLGGNPVLIDGGYFNVPNAPFYRADGRWMGEGWGVEPDIAVLDDPAAAGDPTLDRAIVFMQQELRRKPFRLPPVPRGRDFRPAAVPASQR